MKHSHVLNTTSKVQLPTNWHLKTNQIQRAYLAPTPFLLLRDCCILQIYFLYHGTTDPVGQGLLMIKYSRSHSDTPHSVGLVWTRDQPDAETST